MSREPLSTIFHVKVGGATRHKITTMAYAVIAAEKGWRVEDNTRLIAQKGDEIPDLVISKEDRFHDGARRYKKTLRYAIEIVDTHDPERSEKWLGYEDTIKVYIKKAEEWCRFAHGPLEDYIVGGNSHPLCLDSLIRLCERSIP